MENKPRGATMYWNKVGTPVLKNVSSRSRV